MKKIEFKPGYYEWNLFIDNEFVFSFGDITENIGEILDNNENESYEECFESFADELVEHMILTSKEDNEGNLNFEFNESMKKTILNLTQDEISTIKKVIKNVVVHYYS